MSVSGFEVVRRRDKPTRLAAFFERHSRPLGEAAERAYDCLLVARSLDSFVAQAVFAVARTPFGSSLALRVVIAQPPLDGCEAFEPLELADRGHAIRSARDWRLLDAHEFLILGPSAVWTGDSMRRDPAACDSWERQTFDCRETARLARRSFERFWALADSRPNPALDAPVTMAGAAAALAALRDPGDAPPVPTRH